jgi:hypothetical protein
MNEACWFARPIPGLEIDTGSSRKFEQTQVLFLCFLECSPKTTGTKRSRCCATGGGDAEVELK